MRYKILSDNGAVVQTIIADDTFCEKHYPGRWRAVPETVDTDAARKTEILTRLAAIDAATDKPRTRREIALNRNAALAYVQKLDDEATQLRAELNKLP